jgi:predicted transcriptional regulator of viral defense system
MNWEEFLNKVKGLAVIEAEALYSGTGSVERASTEVQLSRWHKAAKLIQLKRGLYALSDTYRKTDIYGPAVAATLHRPSYLSLEKALEFHNLIPERVVVYTSVTTQRPAEFKTELGTFQYFHIQKAFFWGYSAAVLNGQTAFVAFPEKALLDLFYLRHGPVTGDYIDELRLQNLEDLDEKRLLKFAKKMNKAKIIRAALELKERIINEKQLAKRAKERKSK